MSVLCLPLVSSASKVAKKISYCRLSERNNPSNKPFVIIIQNGHREEAKYKIIMKKYIDIVLLM